MEICGICKLEQQLIQIIDLQGRRKEKKRDLSHPNPKCKNKTRWSDSIFQMLHNEKNHAKVDTG